MDKYHCDGDCGIIELAMQLSGSSFHKFEIDNLPDGYIEYDDFGTRVAKHDWFELLGMFPLWSAFLITAGLAALIGIFWLSCRIKGLHISGQSKHSFCRFFIIFLLIISLLPLVAGLYLSSRANHLLRKNSKEQERYRDLANTKILDQNQLDTYGAAEEFQNKTSQDEYENHMGELIEELDKSISSELMEWQQIMAQNEQNNFKRIKQLLTNKLFYENSLKKLREVAYELVTLGIEIDDYLRDFNRASLYFLKYNNTFEAKNDSNFFQPIKQLNVWHLSALYFRYINTEEYFEYLMAAYSNITKMHEIIAKVTPKMNEIESLQQKATNQKRLPTQYRSNADSQEKYSIQKSILFVALAMVFVTAALIYVLLMSIGFAIFRFYEEANFLIKCFIFLSLLSIVVLALLAVMHFLLTMVLHTGVCHKHDSDSFSRAAGLSTLFEPLDCPPNINNNELNFPASEIRKYLLSYIKREIPLSNIFQPNITNEHSNMAEDPLQEKWYEYDMQALLAIEDGVPSIANVKEHYGTATPEADIFLCKFKRLENLVKQELYAKEFVPNATLLYKIVRNVKKSVQYAASSNSLVKHLENALNEIYSFEQFYATTKTNLLDRLNENSDLILRKFTRKFRTKGGTCARDYKNQMTAIHTTSSATRCGCLEDWLMIYAIGGAVVVLSLFVSMTLSMLLYKLNKRGPPISTPQYPNRDDYAPTKATCVPSAPPAGTACNEGQNACAPGKIV